MLATYGSIMIYDSYRLIFLISNEPFHHGPADFKRGEHMTDVTPGDPRETSDVLKAKTQTACYFLEFTSF